MDILIEHLASIVAISYYLCQDSGLKLFIQQNTQKYTKEIASYI